MMNTVAVAVSFLSLSLSFQPSDQYDTRIESVLLTSMSNEREFVESARIDTESVS